MCELFGRLNTRLTGASELKSAPSFAVQKVEKHEAVVDQFVSSSSGR